MKETNFEPPKVSEVLREHFLALEGVTQEGLAEAMRVSRHSISELMNDRRSITAAMALRLAKVLGTDPEFWMSVQQEREIFEARCKFSREIDALRPLREPVRQEDAEQTFATLFPGASIPKNA